MRSCKCTVVVAWRCTVFRGQRCRDVPEIGMAKTAEKSRSHTQFVDLKCTHDRPSNENRRCLACQFHHLELSPTHGTPLKSLAHPQCFHLVTHHPHPPATCTTAPPPPPPPPPPLPRTPPAKHRPTNPNANPFWRRTWACTIGPRLHPMDEFDPVH